MLVNGKQFHLSAVDACGKTCQRLLQRSSAGKHISTAPCGRFRRCGRAREKAGGAGRQATKTLTFGLRGVDSSMSTGGTPMFTSVRHVKGKLITLIPVGPKSLGIG